MLVPDINTLKTPIQDAMLKPSQFLDIAEFTELLKKGLHAKQVGSHPVFRSQS